MRYLPSPLIRMTWPSVTTLYNPGIFDSAIDCTFAFGATLCRASVMIWVVLSAACTAMAPKASAAEVRNFSMKEPRGSRQKTGRNSGIVQLSHAMPNPVTRRSANGRHSSSWMVFLVQPFQALARHQRINLCGRQRTVAEQHLQGTPI